MRILPVALAIFAAFPALAQNASRTFKLSPHGAVVQIGMILRQLGEVPEMRVDEENATVTVKGTDADLTLADWLIKRLDTDSPLSGSYTIPDKREVLVVTFLAHTPGMPQLNERITSVRTTLDVRRIFSYTPHHAIVYRTEPEKAEMVNWLVRQLDVAPDDAQRFETHEYTVPGKPDSFLKVMYLHEPPSQFGLNELVTTVRVVTDTQRIFTHSDEPRGIVFAGDTAHVRAAEWLITELDVQPDTAVRAAQHSYPLAFAAGETARVYFLNRTDAADALREAVKAIRREVQSARLFTSTARAAIAIRGTPDVIAVADRVMQQLDR
jgi:hypothetical protein